MVSKIFLAVALVSCLAFALISLRVGSQVEDAMHTSTEESAAQTATLVRASIEQAMLSGNGIKVKDLIVELKKSVGNSTSIHVYDPMGIEVFAAPTAAPSPEELPPMVRAVLGDLRRRQEGATVVRALPMEERCAECHSQGDRLRGVLQLQLNEEACASRREEIIVGILRAGFVHLMTARKSHRLPQYFDDVRRHAPGIRAISVYDAQGDAFFGPDMSELGATQELVLRALKRPDESTHLSASESAARIEIVPLRKEERCIECHEAAEEIRGALLVALAPHTEKSCDAAELEGLVDTSLRHIMTSELGRIIALFLESVVATGGIDELVLYDNEGREYWNTTHAPPPDHVAQALALAQPSVSFVGRGENQRMRAMEPLRNSNRCARCHGAEMSLRGLVEVSMSTAKAAQTRDSTKRFMMSTTALAVVAMLFVLIAFLHMLVVRPVGQIGAAADSIGEGNFDVNVASADPKGDEVARLGDRINTMTHELRTKFQLERLVSRGAREAARSGRMQEHAKSGQRVDTTVLFSDIRGFTSFSEKVAAEEVVAMLNTLLKVQTDVVHEHGGDIDKFVGDELMAIFEGEDACARACRCATEMIASVEKSRDHDLAVGIGIATGEVVMGAIGHEARLDFTVIGDVVNTGARLCSAAAPGQVLVTEAVREAAHETALRFVEHEPLRVKGKAEALAIFSVEAVGSDDDTSSS